MRPDRCVCPSRAGTRCRIFEAILGDEEEHIDYLETQLGLLSQLGEQHYVAQLVEQPDD
jgi:bacterioferritin